eukprot:198003-Prymnesium_polylepis.1
MLDDKRQDRPGGPLAGGERGGRGGRAYERSKIKDAYGFDVNSFGKEIPMPGREREYEDFKANGGAQSTMAKAPGYQAPPIDSDRKGRSPGIQNNFYDIPTADFKKPR